MDKNRLKQFINECVAETLKEEKQRARITQIVNEELQKALNEDKKDKDEEKSSTKRNAVMSSLKDPKFNNAQLAYALYNPKDQSEKDTVRSLFSKKATGKPDNDGAIRHFDDDEINKLYQMIRKR